jgi:hypothetical protein
MIPNPTTKGKRTEAVILSKLVCLGKSVLIPWNEERYDVVAIKRRAVSVWRTDD